METTIRSLFDKIHRYKNNLPYSPGFLPYYEDNSYIYIFQRAERWNAMVDQENNLIVNMTGPLWKFEKRMLFIVIQALKEVIKAWTSQYKKSVLNNLLVKKSFFEMNRLLIVNNLGLYIKDTISGKSNHFTHSIPFTFRSFGNVNVRNSGDMSTISNTNIDFSILISKESNEKMLTKKKCLSSTGIVKILELFSTLNQRSTTMERLISVKSPTEKLDDSQFRQLMFYFRNLLP